MANLYENSGFNDPSGQYPKQGYWNKTSVNRADYGDVSVDLTYGGADVGMNFDLKYKTSPSYETNNTKETASGHIVQYDDTFGRERIMIRHRTGSGIELRPDGTVLLSSTNKHILTVASDQSVIIEGDARMIYNGNLDVEVIGDYKLNVGGNSTTTVAGNVVEKLGGRRDTSVEETQTTEVKENYELSILGNNTTMTLGDGTYLTKGTSKQHVEGSAEYFSKGRMDITSEEGAHISSPDINIGATSISVFGATGTIGGKDVIMYTKNMYANKTVYAETICASKNIEAEKTLYAETIMASKNITALETMYAKSIKATENIEATKTITGESMAADTFHGDLDGKASTAALADKATGADTAGSLGDAGTAGSITNTAVAEAVLDTTAVDETLCDTTETALPTAAILGGYLNTSDKGVKRVSIDGSNELKNNINLIEETEGVTTHKLTTGEVRARLRNTNNLTKGGFIARQIADEVLSTDYAITIPTGIGRIVGIKPGAIRADDKDIITTNDAAGGKFFQEIPIHNQLPDPQYIITDQSIVTPNTKLSSKISLAKFLSGRGNKVTLNHFVDNTELPPKPDNLKIATVARNLQQQIAAIESFNKLVEFTNYRLVVTEGLYKKGSDRETLDELSTLSANGQTVVYQIINDKGQADLSKTYELAVRWKDILQFDKLILSYDRYKPTPLGSQLVGQIVLVMPEITEEYDPKYKNKIETRYNNNLQSNEDLIEITQ
jgi:hypothetical protein